MLSISTIKLLFIVGGIVLCVFVARGFKGDARRNETALDLVRRIEKQRDEVYNKNKGP